uniref:2-(3-amino-3-carboxypropyl)histidine synthase subunit 1 n=1 Tax=Parastrongyloides trichosuri TaxID=131310 RepID=A0A0N4ZY05_PARTI
MLKIREEISKITEDPILKKDMEVLPSNYNFEIPKTIYKIRSNNVKCVALQLPEGLLMYACVISDILVKHTNCDTIILGDVTYGACCVDDFTAKALGCDLLVHYGHSCLVPIQDTNGIHLLYVFVSIDINLTHFLEIVKKNFKKEQKLTLVSTIQFVASLHAIKQDLIDYGFNIIIPQSSPLSPGEILGCTSPRVESCDAIIYLGDGRFHLESMMMHNPTIPAFQYNPYNRNLTREEFGFSTMIQNRRRAISLAKNVDTFGLILGTYGRQGNLKVYEEMEELLKSRGKNVIRILISEIFVNKIEKLLNIDAFAQVACPRLSIDWGESFPKPLLNSYELYNLLEKGDLRTDYYAQDYYSSNPEGPYANNHKKHRPEKVRRAPVRIVAEI